MIDWPETRLRLQLWLHLAWPFRVIAWLLDKDLSQERGFGPFRAQVLAPTADQIRHARVCIVDAARPKNSTSTQIDAAIEAIVFLNRNALADKGTQRYLRLKYERQLDALELFAFHAIDLRIAKQLLSSLESKVDEHG